ncbi:MAG: hypothetical protein P1P87_10670 [Trueperaceae bacterium]|nr:hypothetical protein [Trueperaceae bacterium]
MALRPLAIRPVATIVAALGAVLLVGALTDLAGAPERAHQAFSALVQAEGGSMSHSPTYPDTYRSLAAQAIYLRDALLGGAGVVLLGVGAAALLRDGHS